MTEATKISGEVPMATEGEAPKLTNEQEALVQELNVLVQRHEHMLATFIVERAKVNGIATAISEIETRAQEIQKELNNDTSA